MLECKLCGGFIKNWTSSTTGICSRTPSCIKAKRREYQRFRRATDPSYKEYARNWQRTHPENNKAAVKRWLQKDGNSIARRNKRRSNGEPITQETKSYIVLIKNDLCVYCGGIMKEVDHIKAVSRGGGSQWDNLAPTCQTCNRRKGTKDVLQFMLETL